jgi:putative transposase
LHQLTSDLTRRFSTIVLEDLNVRGMARNRRLARAVSDMGFAELRRQVEYKAAMRGGEVIFADRFYPSSKTCSACGHVLDVLPLSVREWACPDCGSHHDRDFNAAVNLKSLAASSAVSACGEEGSGARRKVRVKPASTKQEVSFDHVCA